MCGIKLNESEKLEELIGLRDQSLWWSRRVCWDGLGMLNVMMLSTGSNHDVW